MSYNYNPRSVERTGEGIQDQMQCSTCPGNTGALYHNYKGFFSIVMLALVDGQYKFRWVDVGTEGSCSDGQKFNASQLKRRIEDGRIGFPDPSPITQGGPDVPHMAEGC